MHLKLLTFNVGKNIIADILEGTERPTCIRCRQKYGTTPSGQISECGKNSSVFCSAYDIITVQELSPYYRRQFVSQMRKNAPHKQFTCIPSQNSGTVLYDQDITGPGELLLDISTNRFRLVQAIHFPNLQLVVVNVWGEHGMCQYKDLYKIDWATLIGTRKITRFVLMGDTNDENQSWHNRQITLGDTDIHHVILTEKTCCEDVEFAYNSDYILVDNETRRHIVSSGIPQKLKDKHWKQLYMSDHYPVELQICMGVQKSNQRT